MASEPLEEAPGMHHAWRDYHLHMADSPSLVERKCSDLHCHEYQGQALGTRYYISTSLDTPLLL